MFEKRQSKLCAQLNKAWTSEWNVERLISDRIMVKNLTCRNENTNRKTGDYNLLWNVFVFESLKWILNEINEFALINFLGFTDLIFLLLFILGINENIFRSKVSQSAVLLLPKTTTANSRAMLWKRTSKKKAKSEQRNRRKFLFILFVIISFFIMNI